MLNDEIMHKALGLNVFGLLVSGGWGEAHMPSQAHRIRIDASICQTRHELLCPAPRSMCCSVHELQAAFTFAGHT